MIFKLIFLLSIPDDFLTMCQFLATWLPLLTKMAVTYYCSLLIQWLSVY